MNKTKRDGIYDGKCYSGDDLVLKHHTGAKWPFILKLCALEKFCFPPPKYKKKNMKDVDCSENI